MRRLNTIKGIKQPHPYEDICQESTDVLIANTWHSYELTIPEWDTIRLLDYFEMTEANVNNTIHDTPGNPYPYVCPHWNDVFVEFKLDPSYKWRNYIMSTWMYNWSDWHFLIEENNKLYVSEFSPEDDSNLNYICDIVHWIKYRVTMCEDYSWDKWSIIVENFETWEVNRYLPWKMRGPSPMWMTVWCNWDTFSKSFVWRFYKMWGWINLNSDTPDYIWVLIPWIVNHQQCLVHFHNKWSWWYYTTVKWGKYLVWWLEISDVTTLISDWYMWDASAWRPWCALATVRSNYSLKTWDELRSILSYSMLIDELNSCSNKYYQEMSKWYDWFTLASDSSSAIYIIYNDDFYKVNDRYIYYSNNSYWTSTSKRPSFPI